MVYTLRFVQNYSNIRITEACRCVDLYINLLVKAHNYKSYSSTETLDPRWSVSKGFPYLNIFASKIELRKHLIGAFLNCFGKTSVSPHFARLALVSTKVDFADVEDSRPVAGYGKLYHLKHLDWFIHVVWCRWIGISKWGNIIIMSILSFLIRCLACEIIQHFGSWIILIWISEMLYNSHCLRNSTLINEVQWTNFRLSKMHK